MKRFTFAAALLFIAAAGSIFAENLLNHQFKVAQGSGNVRWSQCAFGPDGILHIVYGTADSSAPGNGIWYVTYDGTTASTPYNILDSDYRSGLRPTISVSVGGQVCVAWGEFATGEVFVRVFNRAAGGWQEIESVADGIGFFEPWNAQDAEGNIYVSWYGEFGGGTWSRAKIDGVWEDAQSMGYGSGKQSSIIVAPNGVVWQAWREKDSGYHMYYSHRTKTTGWTDAKLIPFVGEPSHPSFAVSPDNKVYLASGEITTEDESFQEIWIMELNETSNPIQNVGPNIMQHYPVIACDANGDLHLIIQIGGGDFGDGIKYTNKIGGNWKPWQTMASALPKIGGLSADPFGNVAVSWTNINLRDGNSDIYVNSINPVSPMFFEPPINLGIDIALSNVRKTPGLVYNLTWAANPKNDDRYLKGYKIYMKVGDGQWTPMTEVSPQTKTASFSFADRTQRRLFSIVTVSIGGMESNPVIFGQ